MYIMDNKKIGQFIRELREEAGMSQNDLANKVYVAKSNISRLESGTYSITIDKLLTISKLFQVSFEELIAGRRFDKEDDKNTVEEKQQVLMSVVDERNTLFKNVKRFMLTIILVVLLFLGYFFYTFYNSVEVYSIHSDNNELNIEYGSLTKMRDRIYFSLDISMENVVDEVTLYYNLNDERKDVIKQNTLSTIRFVDYYGYEEYISFKSFDKIINNMYVKVKFSNGDVISYKLSFDREYANVDFFLKKEKENSKLNVDNTNNNEMKIRKDIETAMNILKENVEVINFDVDSVTYEVFILQDGINVKYKENSIEHAYYYGVGNENIFAHKSLVENKWESIYSVNVTTGECGGNNCDYFMNDYNTFIKVINEIINDSK